MVVIAMRVADAHILQTEAVAARDAATMAAAGWTTAVRYRTTLDLGPPEPELKTKRYF
jgi:hypothetical protein